METDTYTAAGLLGQVQVGSFVRGTYAYDAYGRAWDYTEYDATVAHNVIYDRTSYYNDGGVVTQDAVKTVRGSTTTLVSSDYTYNLYGQVSTVETATQTNGGTPVDSETRYYYFTFNGASETASVYYSPNLAGPPVTYVTGYAYDGLGRLKEIDVSDGHPRTLLYQSDLTGQIIRRDQVGTAPHEVHYYFNGIQVGDVSNNGAGSDLDYAQELADRVATQGSGQFHNGTNVAVAYANFDQSYDPLNGYDANASSSYTVVGGDTLQSIAQVVWGDSSLWYLIANANGLSGDDTLTAGMSLIIPNNVINVHNNATTFKPYDPNSAIGYVDPTVPKKASSCGVMGQIILAVIAVVVTVVTWGGASEIAAGLLGVDATSSTAMVLAADALGGAMAGAAGSLASQAFGLATGLQKSFNWGGLAMAAIGGAVGGGIGGTGWAADLTESLGSFASGAITGAVGSVVTQGIGVATGLQKKFDWAGVAAAAVGGGVVNEVDDAFGLNSTTDVAQAGKVGTNTSMPALTPMPSWIPQAVGGIAGAVAGAATRTLIKGTDFGDNIIAVLPDIISATVGDIVSSELGDGLTTSQDTNGPSPSVGGGAGAPMAVIGHNGKWPILGDPGAAPLLRLRDTAMYDTDPDQGPPDPLFGGRKPFFDPSIVNDMGVVGAPAFSIGSGQMAGDQGIETVIVNALRNSLPSTTEQQSGPSSDDGGGILAWLLDGYRTAGRNEMLEDEARGNVIPELQRRPGWTETPNIFRYMSPPQAYDPVGLAAAQAGFQISAALVAADHPDAYGATRDNALQSTINTAALLSTVLSVGGLVRGPVPEIPAEPIAPSGVPIAQSSLAGMAPADVVNMAIQKGLQTPPDSLILWSGFGKDGPAISQAFAQKFGGMTLEMTPGGKWLQQVSDSGELAAQFSRAETQDIWSQVSVHTVSLASGQVRSVLGQVSPASVYMTYELPAVEENPAILGIDPLRLRPIVNLGGN